MRRWELIRNDIEQITMPMTLEEKKCFVRLVNDLKDAYTTLPRYEQALREAARISADLRAECNLAQGNTPASIDTKAYEEEFLQKWKAHAGIEAPTAETHEEIEETPAPKQRKPFPENQSFGFWADWRHGYLKEYQPKLWQRLLDEGRAEAYLTAFDEELEEKANRLEKQMIPKFGLTEDLKKRDPMAWVGTYNNLRQAIREILQEEIYSPVL